MHYLELQDGTKRKWERREGGRERREGGRERGERGEEKEREGERKRGGEEEVVVREGR